jgi:FMN phosphatase YigB (HAD superfamily)
MSEWDGIHTVFFDWGGTLAGLGREGAIWPQCAAAAARLMSRELSWCMYSAADVLTELFDAALLQARQDPEHREVDTYVVLAQWGEQMGFGSPRDWPIGKALHAFWDTWVGALDPIRGATDALAELKRRGYRLGLVSNAAVPLEYGRKELERLGLAPWLDSYTFSSVVTRRKPHPLIYEAALTSMYGPQAKPDGSRILFVGDGPIHDVAGPQRLGMRTALVRHDGFGWPADELQSAKPDLRINHVAELLDVLPPVTK